MIPTINFDALEDSKENIKPLRIGRNAIELAKAVQKNSLEEIHVRYEEEIKKYIGDDPLSIWIQYIEAIQTYYTAGDNKKSKFVQKLEECLLEYKDNDRYRNDERFLKVWLLYTDNLIEPDDVYQFLLKNEICTQFSALYRSYAIYLLRRGQYRKASTIVIRGIECGAHPIRDLRLLLKHIEAALDTCTTNETNEVQDDREILGNSSIVFSRLLIDTNAMKSSQCGNFLINNHTKIMNECEKLRDNHYNKGLPYSTSFTSVESSTNQGRCSNHFIVYDDNQDPCDSPRTISNTLCTSVWKQLPTRALRYKENIIIERWHNNSLHNKTSQKEIEEDSIIDENVYICSNNSNSTNNTMRSYNKSRINTKDRQHISSLKNHTIPLLNSNKQNCNNTNNTTTEETRVMDTVKDPVTNVSTKRFRVAPHIQIYQDITYKD